MNHADWYVNGDAKYENWRKENRKEMLKSHLKIYGIPALVMIAFAIIGTMTR